MKIIQCAIVLFTLLGCGSDDTSNAADLQVKNNSGSSIQKAGQGNDIHSVIVLEVIQVDNYTYLRVKEGENETWIAAPTITVKTGDKVYYQNGMLMTNFQSKELKRTFENILFVDKISTDPGVFNAPVNNEVAMPANHENMMNNQTAPASTGSSKDTIQQDIKVEKPKNGLSIAEILKNPKSYEGKKIVVKGKVTKYTSGVMGKNWVHIQDGTTYDKKFEIVITTSAETKDGDVVTFEGPLTLNKDLGFGYFFEVLMEDAKLLK